MPRGRLLIPLAVLAALVGRAASQTAPNAAAGAGDGCAPACAPAPRVRVIVPPPEVVFCPSGKQGCGLLHRCQPCAAPCPPAPCAQPAAAPAAPGGGMMTFNMTYAMPYMTYQMTPMMMGSAAFGGAGMASGMFGMGGMGGGFGMPLVQPAAGVNLGLGGLQMGLGGNALAAALGINTSAGLSATGTSAVEMQALRALLGRTLGNGADGNGAADGDPETRMRRLSASVAEMNTRINAELANVQQMRSDMDLGLKGLAEMTRRMAEMDKRLKALEPAGRTRPE